MAINKNRLPNLVALFIIATSFLFDGNPRFILLTTGLFAFSGAVTNWLAIHMLFEKVPGLYGSGVIQESFEEFKTGIYHLVMNEFFTKENVDSFFESGDEDPGIDFAGIVEELDFSPAFDTLVNVILESPFSGMLAMIGGAEGLDPLKDPFVTKVKQAFKDITKGADFNRLVKLKLQNTSATDEMLDKVSQIVKTRLDELTPKKVKNIIQEMIREHLGWLVIWGGLFGGLIGLITALIQINV